MFFTNRKIPLIIVSLFLLMGATDGLACGCGGSSAETLRGAVKGALKRSQLVFSGRVVGFEYRKGIESEYMELRKKELGEDFFYETKFVKFEVEHWWKGNPATKVILKTDETKNSDGTASFSSCDFRFEEMGRYLVYAYEKGGEFRTDDCSRTRPADKAGQDLQILGKGKKPPVKSAGRTSQRIPAGDGNLATKFLHYR